MRGTIRFWLCLIAVLGLTACSGDDPAGGDAGTDSGADGSADTDTDGDADTDPACSPDSDDGTGVYWLQCLAGQCLVEDACVWEDGGAAVPLTYDEAVAACPSGYRLPTVPEFMGLLGTCDFDPELTDSGSCATCAESVACSAVYPGIETYDWLAPEILHWSSTPVTGNDSKMWRANFFSGLVDTALKEMAGGTAVCVRTE
jgi:hypothetical protein